MKTEVIKKVFVVLGLGVCTLLLQPDLWRAVLHARRLAEVVQEWQHSGPHTTLLGRARERLAAAGWLAAPRDPLVECGLPVGGGWREVLQLMLHTDESLDCMEKQVQLARQEYVAFKANFLLAAAALGLFTVCLLGWALARNKLAQPHRQPNGWCPLKDIITPSQVQAARAEASYVQGETDISPKQKEEEETLPAHDAGAEFSPIQEEVKESLPAHDEGVEFSPKNEKVEDSLPAHDEGAEFSPKQDEVEESLPAHDEEPEFSPKQKKKEDSLPAHEERAEFSPKKEKVEESLTAHDEGAEFSPKQDEVDKTLPAHDEGTEFYPKQGKVEESLPEHNEAEVLPQQEEQVPRPTQEAARVREAPLQTPPASRLDGVQQEGGGMVRRSLNVPHRLKERLVGTDEHFLEYLRRRHSVLIYMDPARKKMHIKGAEKNALECYSAVKALLAEWLGRDADPAQ